MRNDDRYLCMYSVYLKSSVDKYLNGSNYCYNNTFDDLKIKLLENLVYRY